MSSLKNINLKICIFWAADAWNNMKETTIQKTWNKILDELKDSTEILQEPDEEDTIYEWPCDRNTCIQKPNS